MKTPMDEPVKIGGGLVVLGGIIQSILQAAELPILMAH